MDQLAERIRERMREMGMVNPQGEPNINELHDRSGVSYGALHPVVKGDTKNPSIETVAKVATALRVSVDWLLGEDSFDLRAYEQGRESIANAVKEAIATSLSSNPASGGRASESSRKSRAKKPARKLKEG